MKNDQLLEEIRRLFESFDKDLDEVTKAVCRLQGVVEEMQRHNGRTIKILASIITALLGVIGTLLWMVAH